MTRHSSLVACAVLALAVVDAQAAGPKGTSQRQAAASAAPAPAATANHAQAPAGADLTTASYGDWLLRCRGGGAAQAGKPAAQRSCEIVQSVIIKGQTSPFAQLAFGKVAPGEPLHLTAVVPINVAFPSAVRVALDEKDKQPVELAWTRCMPGGCFASVVAKDDYLKRWRGQDNAGRFTFKNSAGQDLTLPFSFRGLARALDALAKEG